MSTLPAPAAETLPLATAAMRPRVMSNARPIPLALALAAVILLQGAAAAALAEGVLRIKADIRDLYINAPDVSRSGITRTYTLSVGELTLVGELRDAPTGDLIARIVDHRRDPKHQSLELTTRVENTDVVRRAAERWAKALREQLDAEHGTAAGQR